MGATAVPQLNLTPMLGKTISEICPNQYTNATDNHCAHFVSHVLGYTFGFKCRQMTGKGPSPGASIRVHEMFARCPQVGRWADRPSMLASCLVFITNAGNVRLQQRTMDNVPRKHVGIFWTGRVYHYSNSTDRVVVQTPDEFSRHYPSPDNAVFYGSFPNAT